MKPGEVIYIVLIGLTLQIMILVITVSLCEIKGVQDTKYFGKTHVKIDKTKYELTEDTTHYILKEK